MDDAVGPAGLEVTKRRVEPTENRRADVAHPRSAAMQPPPRVVRPRIWPRAWLSIVVVTMLVSSEYKLRLRPPAATLRGQLDLQIVMELGVYALVALFLFVQLGYPRRRQRPPAVLLAAGYFSIVMLTSTLWAVYPGPAFIRGCQLVIMASLAWTIYHYGRRDQLLRLVHAYIVLVTLSVAVGVLHPYARGPLVLHRFNWLYVHPVIAGTYLGLAVVLLVALLLGAPRSHQLLRWPPWLYGILLAAAVTALLATRTRGALGGCAVGCIAVLFAGRRRVSRRDLLGLGITGGILAAIVVGDDIVGFILRGEGAARLETLNGRLDLWQEAIDLVRQEPVLGYGLTASRGLFLSSTGLGGAHNAFINVLVDGGLVGGACWLALIATVFVAIGRLRNSSAVQLDVPLLLGSMVFLVVNSMTAEGLSVPANIASIWLYVVVGWLGVLRRQAA